MNVGKIAQSYVFFIIRANLFRHISLVAITLTDFPPSMTDYIPAGKGGDGHHFREKGSVAAMSADDEARWARYLPGWVAHRWASASK